jgi:RNAse (barnase) inhibitor barstar
MVPSSWLLSQQDYVSRLSIVSGQSRDSFVKAIPHLGKTQKGQSGRPRQHASYACRRCVAQRAGVPDHSVWTWGSRHDQVCIPHRLWIGRAVDSPSRQFDLTEFPDVVEAQRRHRLLRRHGNLLLDACYQYGSAFWHSMFQRGYRLSDRAERFRQMSPVNGRVRPFDPRRYVAVYPEIVETISLYASPHWRKVALADDEKFERFKAEFNRRLPQERTLRNTTRDWFLTELRQIAVRVEAVAESSQLGWPADADLTAHDPNREVVIAVGSVRSERDLHEVLKQELGFPSFYGMNWNAFWDAVTGLVEMPNRLRFVRWTEMELRVPLAATMLGDQLKRYDETVQGISVAYDQ